MHSHDSLIRSALCHFIVLLALIPATACGQPTADTARFRLHFDDPGYTTAADTILARTRAQLQKLLGDSLDFQSDVYLAANLQRFDSLVGGRFPEWGAAAALPHLRRIVLKSPARFSNSKPLEELLAHEYAHLALAHRVGWREPPRWFNEGLSILVSMEWDWGNDVTMSLSALTGRYVPLPEIEQVNRLGQGKARLAYSESYLAVQYFFDTYGTPAVSIFLDSIAAGASYDNALMASTGSDYADFEREFRVYLDRRFNLASLFADMMYFWLGLAVVLIVGGIISMRRRRRYLDQWEKDEELASTDFDYGDPDHPEKLDDDDEAWRH